MNIRMENGQTYLYQDVTGYREDAWLVHRAGWIYKENISSIVASRPSW